MLVFIRPRCCLYSMSGLYIDQTFPLTICWSVGLSVCPLHCGKTADRIWMPFGTVGRTGPGIRQVVGFGDRSAGRATFGGKYGALHSNQWGHCSVTVPKCVNCSSCGLGWCVGSAEAWRPLRAREGGVLGVYVPRFLLLGNPMA